MSRHQCRRGRMRPYVTLYSGESGEQMQRGLLCAGNVSVGTRVTPTGVPASRKRQARIRLRRPTTVLVHYCKDVGPFLYSRSWVITWLKTYRHVAYISEATPYSPTNNTHPPVSYNTRPTVPPILSTRQVRRSRVRFCDLCGGNNILFGSGCVLLFWLIHRS